MFYGSLVALAITIAIEVPIVAALFPKQRLRMAIVCLFTTGATNFFMNTLLIRWSSSYSQFIVLGELGALFLEGFVYAVASRPRDIPRAFVASAVANAASYAAGLWVF